MATINAIGSNIPIQVSNGGTGRATLTNHGVLVGAGTSAITQLGVGTNGQALIGSSAADPSFATLGTSAASLTYTTGAHSLNIDLKSWVAKTSWTPVLSFGGGTTGITYGTQQGSYVRIGSLVFIEMIIVLTSKGSSTGNISITGLPFTGSVVQPMYFQVSAITWTAGQILTCVMGIAPANLQISRINPLVGSPSLLTDANFTNTSTVRIEGCYLL